MNDTKYHLALSVSHNSSAALMRDGEIIVATCEERFCRKKNYIGYPKESIDYCLKKAGISGAQLSRIAYTTIDNPGVLVKSKTNTQFSLADYRDYYGEKYYQRKLNGQDCTDYLLWLRDAPQFNQDKEYFDFSYLTDEVIKNGKLDLELFRNESARLLSIHLGISQERIEFLDHHTCHAYYAYWGSPYRGRDCIAVTLDGWGDGRNQTTWKISREQFSLLAESSQNDLGRIYKMATLILGMRPDEHEFKVMGLAPYAKESYVARAMKLIEDICEVEGMRIISKNRPLNLFEFLADGWKDHRFDNIAGAVQSYVEKIAVALFRNIAHETGISRFVLSGGIAMNIKMNKVIAELPEVQEIFVCGSGGDESLSIGGCYLLNEHEGNNAPINHLYLGFNISDEFNTFDPDVFSEKFTVCKNVRAIDVARHLYAGDIVGVIRGAAEFGARALGNRSILAHPGIRNSVKKINEAIKNRDFWMPFALSILEERHGDYLSNPKNLKSPFMAIGVDALPERLAEIEAGTHPYDATVRPQFVSAIYSPKYHDLISEFGKLSGTPALLNTSFNLHGEPIVNTIADAIRTFKLSGLDHLFINDSVLLSKRKPC